MHWHLTNDILISWKPDEAKLKNYLEHAFQFVGELTAALCLEFCNHCFLSIMIGTFAKEQPFGQILLVERFKHIFALQSANVPAW